jgi:hypothetical protein
MAWAPVKLFKDTVLAFIDDEALRRGAGVSLGWVRMWCGK